MKYFIYTVIGTVAAAIIAGFFVVGSPREERLRRFDDQRVQDLQMLQSYIGEFYRAKSKLPQGLAELNDRFRGIIVPKDPETGSGYEYEIKGLLTFELCATFNRPGLEDSSFLPKEALRTAVTRPGPFGDTTWEHPAGRFCFERTIDKDFFAPEKRR